MRIDKAIAYVEAHGTSLERARLAALTEGAYAPEPVLAAFLALQGDDGAWPLSFQPGQPGTLNHTCLALAWLAELDELERPEAERALHYLAERQRPRGFWREDQRLQGQAIPPWMDPESSAADIYTTALCASTLAVHSDQHDLEGDRAALWLQPQVSREGLLPGFRLHSTWQALPAFTRYIGHKSKTTRRMVVGLAQELSAEWLGSMVAALLNALRDAGYRETTQLVERALALLDEQQQPDGSWQAEEPDEQVQATLLAIRAARRFGVAA